jgi:hypothetical protein
VRFSDGPYPHAPAISFVSIFIVFKEDSKTMAVVLKNIIAKDLKCIFIFYFLKCLIKIKKQTEFARKEKLMG